MKIAINGCGVAGPALAWWLQHYGHEPLLVEKAPGLREGGYVIDFWGLGYDIAEKMGIVPTLRQRGYQVGEVRLVGRDGQKVGGFLVDAITRLMKGRFTSLRRSDVSAGIYEALGGRVETLFGDGIAACDDRGDRVHIAFDKAAPRDVDLVIGADGLHSQVRALAFGPEQRFERFLGYHVAAADLSGYRPRDELVYVSHTEPGRQVARFAMPGDRTLVFFIFRDPLLDGRAPNDEAGQKAALRKVFGGMEWECPQILDALDGAGSFFFDRVSQIELEHWSTGRIGLVGDAAACVSLLAGEGTGLAIAEAYVLAGELAAANGDHAAAFAAYECRLKPFLAGKQKSARAFASSFAPKTRFGIAVRNIVTRLMGVSWIADYFVGNDLRDDIVLPDYAGVAMR